MKGSSGEIMHIVPSGGGGGGGGGGGWLEKVFKKMERLIPVTSSGEKVSLQS